VLGGARRSGGQPLQDAWRREVDGSWTEIVAPVAIDALGVDKTRPALEDASATWDPVGERVLLYGGTNLGGVETAQSATLWALMPTEGVFKQMDDQGDPPIELGASPVFATGALGNQAWLVGTSPSNTGSDELTEGGLMVHSLDLAVLHWEPAASPVGKVGISGEHRSLVGGASEDGLDLVHLAPTGALVTATYDGATWSSSAVESDSTYKGIITGAYDAVSRTTALWLVGAGGSVEMAVVAHATAQVVVLADQVADILDGPMVMHPELGALGVGGQDLQGVTRSSRTLFGQSCP